MNTRTIVWTVIGVLTLVLTLLFVEIHTVDGNQVGVKETWDGVEPTPMQAGTYFLIPGFTQKVFNYDLGIQVYVMNDRDDGNEYGEGRRADAYVVQSRDQQDMRISMRVQWRRLPDKTVELHKYARNQVEERLLRPALLNVVKNQATIRTALDAYAGATLVQLQADVLKDLQAHPELSQYIRVENFIIEHIGLQKDYTDQIVARQVAVQRKLRADEETKAAEAEALRAKAVAQADYEKVLVEARRDKERGILSAEQQKQQAILAAQAEAERVKLAAEAEKNRNVSIAQGQAEAGALQAKSVLALGQAEAEATRLKLTAYSAEGAEAFVRIEVARQMAVAFQNIKGYLPEGMSVNLFTEQFQKGVNVLVGAETK